MNAHLKDDSETPDETAELIQRLKDSHGLACTSCRRPLCAHQVLANIAFGSGNAPKCLECMATALERPIPELTDSLVGYFQSRACFQAAWDWAHQNGESPGKYPCCVLAR